MLQRSEPKLLRPVRLRPDHILDHYCCYLGHSELGSFALRAEAEETSDWFKLLGLKPDVFITTICVIY